MNRQTLVGNWPRLGMGCARVGSFSNPATLRQSRTFLEEAARAGMSLFDTADIYGQGDSERVVGQAAARMQPMPVVVTKGGQQFSGKARLLSAVKPLLRPILSRRGSANAVTARRGDHMRSDWSAAYIARTLPASLRRLNLPCVDAFLLHGPPASAIGDPATVAVMSSFLEQGLARHVGISCEDIASLDAVLRQPVYSVVELDWSDIATISRTPRAEAIVSRGVAVIARGIVSQRAGLDPIAAFERALAEPLVTTALVGTQTPERLRAIAGHFASALEQDPA
jgi:Predicted oxidoreductases (related to aryl-alcohol dehydrogenases)